MKDHAEEKPKPTPDVVTERDTVASRKRAVEAMYQPAKMIFVDWQGWAKIYKKTINQLALYSSTQQQKKSDEANRWAIERGTWSCRRKAPCHPIPIQIRQEKIWKVDWRNGKWCLTEERPFPKDCCATCVMSSWDGETNTTISQTNSKMQMMILPSRPQAHHKRNEKQKTKKWSYKCKKDGHYANKCDEEDIQDEVAIRKGWILLDSHSTVAMFWNAKFLTNICDKNKSGTILQLWEGNYQQEKRSQGLWYCEVLSWQNHNILSLSNVQCKHKVMYDSTLNQGFLVHKADGTTQVFTINDGL